MGGQEDEKKEFDSNIILEYDVSNKRMSDDRKETAGSSGENSAGESGYEMSKSN